MKAKTDGDQIQSDLEFLKLERLKLESQNNQNQIPVLQLPDGLMTVGIDGGFIRARGKQGCFEVIAGKSMVAFKRNVPEDEDSSSSKCFSFVRTFDKNYKHRFQKHLKAHGLTENQKLEFFSDGGESVRGLQKDFSQNVDHILDWFHITMRLTVPGQYAKGLPDGAMLEKARANWEASTPDWQDLDSTDGLPGCTRETASDLASNAEDEEIEVWEQAHRSISPFLVILLTIIKFDGTPAMKGLLDAINFVKRTTGTAQSTWGEPPRAFIPRTWLGLIFVSSKVNPVTKTKVATSSNTNKKNADNAGNTRKTFKRHHYLVCVAHQLHAALKRGDVFVVRSNNHGDPLSRRLLAGCQP